MNGNHEFAAMAAGLDMMHKALATRTMACVKCLWHGPIAECDNWNGNLICPECGSDVREVRG